MLAICELELVKFTRTQTFGRKPSDGYVKEVEVMNGFQRNTRYSLFSSFQRSF